MENLNLVLLSGGLFVCTPEWNAEPFGKDSCFKIYFPVEGSAFVMIGGTWHKLHAGHAYFLNGFLLDKYRCEDLMKVYWLHFIPESQYLSMQLNSMQPLYSWSKEEFLPICGDYGKIPLLFDNPYMRDNNLAEMSSFSLTCRIHAMILHLISDMAERQSTWIGKHSHDLYAKLEPAIRFINENYAQNLKLEDIAQKAFLNPIYFLRLFKKCFKITPNHYLNMIRLQEACRLLMKTNLSIREIAVSTGFCNQFYFSKVFKSHFRKTPLEYRYTGFSP